MLAMVEICEVIPVTPPELWRALTDPVAVSCWLGDLSEYALNGNPSPLKENVLENLTFEDGDFVAVEVTRGEPPTRLECISRSFGIGPGEEITWHITPHQAGCQVTLTSSDPRRGLDAELAARRIWREHIDRLIEYLTSGSSAPRPRQTVVSLGAELPGSVEMVWDWLTQAPTATSWFPLRGPLMGDDVAFRAKTGEEHQEWTVTDLVVDAREHALTFRLVHRDWVQPTTCRLDLQPRKDCALLTVTHSGWDAIVPDSDARWRARREFAALWFKVVLSVTLTYVRTLQIPTISPEELRTRLDEPNLFLYDTNRITLWRQGHIPGAVHVGQEEIAPDVLPADRQASLVFYCRDER